MKALLLTSCVLLACSAYCQEFHPKDTVPNYDVPIHNHGQYAAGRDGNIYYEKEGHGPVVIIVAGGPGGDHTSFHPFFSLLAKDHTVVYFDNIGRGKSDALKDPKGYTVQRDAEDIEDLRIALKQDKIDVIGHWHGGMPALAYALKYPEHTAHVVLSDTLHSADGFQQNIDSCNFFVAHQYADVWAKLVAMHDKGVKSGSDEYENLYGSVINCLYWCDESHEKLMFRSGDKHTPGPDIYQTMIGDDPRSSSAGP